MKERFVRRFIAALSFTLIGSMSVASWAAPTTKKAATKPAAAKPVAAKPAAKPAKPAAVAKPAAKPAAAAKVAAAAPAAVATGASGSSADLLLKFFPAKPLVVFRTNSLRRIVQDIEDIATNAGFGAPIAMGKMQAFGAAQNFLQLKQPVNSLAQLLKTVGLGEDPRIAIAGIETSVRPYIYPIVVMEVKNAGTLTRLVTKTLPMLRDQNRFKRCKSSQKQLQNMLAMKIAKDGKKQYTMRDLSRGSFRVFKLQSCARGVKFKIVGDKVVSPSLDGGFDNFRKLHGTFAKVNVAGNVQKVTLDQFTYAMLNNRYMVWAMEATQLDAALKRFSTNTSQFLSKGFASNLSTNSRFQLYMDYERYMGMMMKMQNMINKMNPRAANPFMNPQLKQLQKLSQSMVKGLESMWMEARVKGKRYQIFSTLTIGKKRSPLMEVFWKVKPTPIKSLGMLSGNTVAVMSMNMLQAYFDFASIMLKQMGNKALSQFVFSINQWKAMFGNEVTLSVGSAPGKPIQAALLIEVKQAAQLQQLLMSLTMMLGAGGKSPLKTAMHQNVPITYFFKGRGRSKPGRRSPTDRLPPGELAFAFVNNYFVLTYQMTRKSDLSMLKRMIDPKLRAQSSLLSNPILLSLLRRTQKTNGLLFISVPQLLKAVRMFAPPLPQVQQALRIASSISYLFAHGRIEHSQSRSSGVMELGLSTSKKK